MFDKLSLKTIKDIVREYELTTHISFSRLVEGKRKPFTKKELADKLHKHLEIKEDGEIVYKQRQPMTIKYKPEEKKTRTKKVKEAVVEAVVEPVKKAKKLKKKTKLIIKPKKEKEMPLEEIVIQSDSAKKKSLETPEEILQSLKDDLDEITILTNQRKKIIPESFLPEINKIVDKIKNLKDFVNSEDEDLTQEDLLRLARSKISVESNDPKIKSIKKQITDIDDELRRLRDKQITDFDNYKSKASEQDILKYEIYKSDYIANSPFSDETTKNTENERGTFLKKRLKDLYGSGFKKRF